MSKIDLVPVTGAQNISAINDNFTKVAEALNDGVLYRDNPSGQPNMMKNDLDMNGKRIYNLPVPTSDSEPARLADLKNQVIGGSYEKTLRVTDIALDALPDAVNRAGRLLSFDANGQPRVQFPSVDSATQLRSDLASDAGWSLIGGKPPQLQTYADLALYNGPENTLDISAVGIAGRFHRRGTASENGGTVIKDALGRSWEREYTGEIRLSWFEAKLDGVTPDQVATQRAIDACRVAGWTPLVVDGLARIGASLIVDRPVDQNADEWQIIGEGAKAGFLIDHGVTLFDSSIAMPTKDPVAEFVTLKQLNIRQAAYWDECYVFSKKFIRIKSIDCFFWMTRFQGSDSSYSQTLHFIGCNIHNNRPSFIDTKGSYDVVFTNCVIENGGTVVRSIDTEVGTSGLRFIGCVIEGLQTSTVVATGVAGFALIGCHLESNVANDFNLWAGSLPNKSIVITGNYIYAPNGAVFYHGATESVISTGNTCFPSNLHDGAARCASLISIGDSGSVESVAPKINFGGYHEYAGDPDFAIGTASTADSRMRVLARAANTRIFDALTASGLDVLVAYANGQVAIPRISSAANDTTAAAAGVPLGGLYHDGGNVRVRIV